MSDHPLYESQPTWKNLKQRYAVYRDHVELDIRWYRTLVIPVADIVVVGVRGGPVVKDLIGGHPQFNRLRALKLDLADLFDHVALVKQRGFWQQLRFTPDNPEAFVAACKRVLPRDAFIESW